MLVFDRFPTYDAAIDFAIKVRKTMRLETIICRTEEQAAEFDLFPFELTSPIVLVARFYPIQEEVERLVEKWATEYGGTFAGT